MLLTVQCPKCSLELEAPDDLVGKPATCPGCTSQFIVTSENSRRKTDTAEPVKQSIPAPSRRSSKSTSPSMESVSAPMASTAALPPGKERSHSSQTPSLPSQTLPANPSFGGAESGASPEVPGSATGSPPADQAPSAAIGSGSTKAGKAKFKGLPVEPDTSPPDAGTSAGSSPTAVPSASTTNSASPTDSVASTPAATPLLAQSPPPTPDAASVEQSTSDAAEAPKKKSRRRKKDRLKKRVQRTIEKRSSTRAKIVEAGSIETRIQMGADGSLPQLVVKELETKESPTQTQNNSNPMVLVAVLCFSVLMSVAILFVPSERSASSELNLSDSLEHLRENYFGQEPFRDYEIMLREAVQHENRGDRPAAKAIYRRVLDMIHAEGLNERQGLSGPRYALSPPNDADLEQHLEFLIRTRN